MKVLVLGVTQSSGISKKNGNRYLMTSAHVIVDFVPFTNKDQKNPDSPHHNVAGFGKAIAEIPVHDEIFTTFGKLTFPLELELDTDSAFRNGRMETVVTGFKQV